MHFLVYFQCIVSRSWYTQDRIELFILDVRWRTPNIGCECWGRSQTSGLPMNATRWRCSIWRRSERSGSERPPSQQCSGEYGV